MPNLKINTDAAKIDFGDIRRELQIPQDYPADAVQQAVQLAQQPLPDDLPDQTDIPFVTIDPPGSKDLDQALHIEATAGGGFLVRYAIADVARFVTPDSPIDLESRRRGQTYYSPDLITPLHPVELSEGAASLLADQVRPAVVWSIELDATGEVVSVDLRRALVRSVAQLDYATVQQTVESGTMHPSIALLEQVGPLRLALARQRHAITLDLPDAEIERTADGQWTLQLRAVLPVEQWNAEISLLTGMCAAKIMLDNGFGLLRTLPSPTERDIKRLRRETSALGIPWPDGAPPGDVIAGLDGSTPADAAFLQDALALLRGAGYTAFDGTPPKDSGHAGVGAPYAHVTAPLRRLCDRYATEICLAQVAGAEVPGWVRQVLPEVIDTMARTDRTAHDLERRCEAAVSDFLLATRVGQRLSGVVVQIDDNGDAKKARATVALDDPPVSVKAPAAGLTEGSRIDVQVQPNDNGGYSATPVRAN